MSSNPIILAVAQAAADKDWRISSITLASPLITSAPVLSINWAHFERSSSNTINGKTLDGVSVLSAERVPDTLITLKPMTDIESIVIDAAWHQGAWDINRTAIAKGYAGSLPAYIAPIRCAALVEGYVTWHWRPMLGGPEIRIKANAKKDKTLNRWSFGRDTDAPQIATLRTASGTQYIIKLGHSEEELKPEKKSAKTRKLATQRQIVYLSRLMRAANIHKPLPVNLTLREASQRINELAPKQKSARPYTLNQWRLIDHLMLRLGQRSHMPLKMSYDEANALIAELKAKI